MFSQTDDIHAAGSEEQHRFLQVPHPRPLSKREIHAQGEIPLPAFPVDSLFDQL
jgi:hypothetical protein